MRVWLAFVRPGDWLLIAFSLAAIAFGFSQVWQGGFAERAIIRQAGSVFADVALNQSKHIEVPGPLGITRIHIETGRARVIADPGPRQYCVRQGWLQQPGDIALCAPNQVSVHILGRTRRYDSLSY